MTCKQCSAKVPVSPDAKLMMNTVEDQVAQLTRTLDVLLDMLSDVYLVTQKIAGKVGMEIIPSPQVQDLLDCLQDHRS